MFGRWIVSQKLTLSTDEHQNFTDSPFNERTCKGFEVLCLLTTLQIRIFPLFLPKCRGLSWFQKCILTAFPASLQSSPGEGLKLYDWFGGTWFLDAFSSASPSLGAACRHILGNDVVQSSTDLMLSGQPKAVANTAPTEKAISKQFGFLHLKSTWLLLWTPKSHFRPSPKFLLCLEAKWNG